ncbi:MAG: polysaccharide deacetylase family protein [Proteobacteria bacterium]|nr:polysaccharide deacetylase family protein [Pseudomonadota bacterium]
MIYAIHGVVQNFSQKKFCHRDFLDYNLFKTHLRTRKKKYVSLEKALENKGDALTIDDSLLGALEAAILCRNFGHDVSLFINPFYIEERILYWFCLLNIFLDHAPSIKIIWENEEYLLNSFEEKIKFRIKIKNKIAKLPTEEERQTFLKLFSKDFFDCHFQIPSHLDLLTIDDLRNARNLGIEIHNHGWTHRQLTEVSHIELDEEILKAKKWFQNKLYINTDFYAVPFGKDLPSDKYNFDNFRIWFLTYYQLHYGKIGPKIYNRAPLILK